MIDFDQSKGKARASPIESSPPLKLNVRLKKGGEMLVVEKIQVVDATYLETSDDSTSDVEEPLKEEAIPPEEVFQLSIMMLLQSAALVVALITLALVLK